MFSHPEAIECDNASCKLADDRKRPVVLLQKPTTRPHTSAGHDQSAFSSCHTLSFFRALTGRFREVPSLWRGALQSGVIPNRKAGMPQGMRTVKPRPARLRPSPSPEMT